MAMGEVEMADPDAEDGGTPPETAVRGRLDSNRGSGGSTDVDKPPPGQAKAILILHTNAQSLAGKVNELSVVASEIKPDIIALTETWCNSDITDAEL